MQAAYFYEPGQIKVEGYGDAEYPGNQEMLIHVRAASICRRICGSPSMGISKSRQASGGCWATKSPARSCRSAN